VLELNRRCDVKINDGSVQEGVGIRGPDVMSKLVLVSGRLDVMSKLVLPCSTADLSGCANPMELLPNACVGRYIDVRYPYILVTST
jgi:hypothetical protein